MKKIIFLLLIFLFMFSSVCFAMTSAEEKKLFQDIAEIKATLKVFMEQVDKRFEQIDKRFEQIDKRFEQVDKRFEQVDKRFEIVNIRFEELREDMNKRFDQMMNFLWILTAIFTTLTATVIGFAYWDRRTIIRKARDEAIERIEREGRLRDLINALRELSREDRKLAAVLRQFSLL